MEPLDLNSVLQSWITRMQVPGALSVGDEATTAAALTLLETNGFPPNVWLREYVEEASGAFHFGETFRPAALASVKRLPLPDVTEHEAAMAAFRFMLRMLAGDRSGSSYALLSTVRPLIVHL